MSKLNQKGFMMAEVVIVSTIILGTLVGLYSIFSRMYVVYTERSYYYNVDAVYALRNVYKNLIDNDKMVPLINDGLEEDTEELVNYVELINDNTCGAGYIDSNLCMNIKKAYGISRVIFARYDENTFTNVNISTNSYENLLNDYKDDVMGDYLEYIEGSMDFNEDYSYIFIAELVDGDYRYYGNYRIR